MIIKINKLFGKYNNEIDFSKKCNILIGENGIGKSTSIKIINCLLKFDYIGLLKYYFESIELISDSESILIKYEDIAISKDYLFKKFCGKDYEKYMEIKPDYKEYNEKYKINPMAADFLEKTNELYKKNWYKYSFYWNYDLLNEQIDYRLLYKILKNDDKILSSESIVTMASDYNVADKYILYIRKVYNKEKINKKDGRFYLNSNIAQRHTLVKNILKSLKYQNALLVNMASDFEVNNDVTRKYAENKFEFEILKQDYRKKEKDNKKNQNSSILNYTSDNRNINEKYARLQDKSIIKKLKKNYKIIRKEGVYENQIDFGYFLFNQIYTDNLLNEFKNDLYDFIHENINKFSKEVQEIQITNEYYNKIKLYLKPLLDTENIFYDKLIGEWMPKTVYEQEFQLLIEFAKKYWHKYIEIKNEKLIKLNQLFEKYFTNKEIIATPFGISISTKDYSNDIYFEELSAGEQKIIVLLTICVFSDDLVILLDEPENSLSIIWQEQLIPDLINYTNFNKIIVATQSPYIVRSEELLSNIIYLPTEEN